MKMRFEVKNMCPMCGKKGLSDEEMELTEVGLICKNCNADIEVIKHEDYGIYYLNDFCS